MNFIHYQKLPEHPHLSTGECQLWLAWLDEETPASFLGFLSEDECQRARRLCTSRTAERYIIGRGILRQLLAGYLVTNPEQLIFSYGPHGKPQLAGELKGRLSFNVSHSGDLAVFAIANGLEVGLDIEKVHPVRDLEATASIFLSEHEIAELRSFTAEGKLERFFTLWTCKEAVLKAIGSGFHGSIKGILESFSQPKRTSTSLSVFDVAEGYKGALACCQPL